MSLPFSTTLEVASLPVAALSVWLMYRLASNHIVHVGDRIVEAIERLREDVQRLPHKDD